MKKLNDDSSMTNHELFLSENFDLKLIDLVEEDNW